MYHPYGQYEQSHKNINLFAIQIGKQILGNQFYMRKPQNKLK